VGQSQPLLLISPKLVYSIIPCMHNSTNRAKPRVDHCATRLPKTGTAAPVKGTMVLVDLNEVTRISAWSEIVDCDRTVNVTTYIARHVPGWYRNEGYCSHRNGR